MSNAKPIILVANTGQDTDSHADHLSAAHMQFVLDTLNAGGGKVLVGPFGDFSIVALTLPNGETSTCALRGPLVGDAPIQDSQVRMAKRAGRPNESRIVDSLPGLPRNDVVAIVSGNKLDPATRVLVTAYAGPLAPQEPSDPFLSPDAKPASEAFWREHALSAKSVGL